MTYATSMRVKPIERQAIKSGAVTKHNARTGKLPENVDAARVDQNRVLVGTADPARDLATEIDGVPMSRKGENPSLEFVGAEIVLTAHHEFFEGLSEQDFEKWVTKNIEYLQKKFDGVGEHGKLVNAILHMDEKSPHIHGVVAPVIEKSRVHPVTKERTEAKKQINYTHIFLDRKKILGKARAEGRSHLDTKLGRMQTEYAGAMSEFGLIRGVESVRSKDKEVKHVTPKEYRAAVEGLEKQISEKRAEYASVQKAVGAAKAQKENMEKEAAALAQKIEERQKGMKEVETALAAKKSELQAVEKMVAEKSALVSEFEGKAAGIMSRAKSEYAAAQKQIGDLKKETEELQANYLQNKSALESWKTAVVDAEKKCQSLRDEAAKLEKLAAEIPGKKSELAKLELEIKSKGEWVDELQRMRDIMENTQKKTQMEIYKMDAQLEKLKDSVAEKTVVPTWSLLCQQAGDANKAAQFVKGLPEDLARAVVKTVQKEETKQALLKLIREAHAPAKSRSHGMSMGR